jgi:pilus assembly protein CpaB
MARALSDHLTQVRRAIGAHRRLLAAGFAAVAVAAGLNVVAPPAPPTMSVVVASTDLPAGTSLGADHLQTAHTPTDLAPRGALTNADDAIGGVLGAPLRAGEVLTDVRLLGPPLVDAYGGGRVAAPVRIADAEAVRLLQTGDRVDVLAADPSGVAETVVVASAAPVVVVPDAGDAVASTPSGGLVVLAVTPDTARQLVRAAVVGPLSVTLRG